MKSWINRNPWIWIVVFFLSYVIAWSGLITIAVKNVPPSLEEAHLSTHTDGS